MLFFFLSSVNSVLPKCIASSKVSTIPSDYEIIQYQVIIKSGSHSPKNIFLSREKRGFWYCDSKNAHSSRINVFPFEKPRSIYSIIDKRYSEYPPNCFLNDLTVEGMNQIHDLGLSYRNYLLSTDSKYFNDGKITQKISIRATNEDNSFRNAVSFLTGFFNDEKVGDLDIITGTKNKEIIIPNEKYCKDIQKIISDFESSNECKKIISNAIKDLNPILPLLNYKKDSNLTKKQIIDICDFIISMHCNEQITDLNLTENFVDKIESYYSKLNFNPFFSVSKSKIGIGASTLMREILRIFNKRDENSVKFSLYSADDSSIAAVLALLKHERIMIPYASHVSIAFLKKNNTDYIQISFNGNPIKLPKTEETICSYSDFYNYVSNYTDYCHELP